MPDPPPSPPPPSAPPPRALLACVCANLGGLLVGQQLALFSGILEMRAFQSAMAPPALTARAKGFVTAALVLGAVAAAPPAGPLVDRHGRRPALLATPALFLAAALLMARARRLAHVLLARVLAGFAYAVANVVCPMYSAELAPPAVRGLVVNLYQLAITAGIFLAQAANARFWDSPQWSAPLWLAAAPAALMLAAVAAAVPESPPWLLARDRPAAARAAAHWLRMPHLADEERDLEAAGREKGGGSLRAMLADPSARRRLLIGAGLGAAQQCTGINAVIFFGPALVADVLRMAGSAAPFRAAAVVGLGNMAASLLSMGVIERYGRRRLLLAAGPPMVVSLVALGLMRDGVLPSSDVLGVGALITFIVAFAITYGPLTFLVQSEVFPVRYKGVAMSACSMVMMFMALVIAATFLPLLEWLGGGIYYMYASCVVASSAFIYRFVPETRNMSLKDIDALLSS